MTKLIPIFLDTDPGIDDAVAIAAAIFAPRTRPATDDHRRG